MDNYQQLINQGNKVFESQAEASSYNLLEQQRAARSRQNRQGQFKRLQIAQIQQQMQTNADEDETLGLQFQGPPQQINQSSGVPCSQQHRQNLPQKQIALLNNQSLPRVAPDREQPPEMHVQYSQEDPTDPNQQFIFLKINQRQNTHKKNIQSLRNVQNQLLQNNEPRVINYDSLMVQTQQRPQLSNIMQISAQPKTCQNVNSSSFVRSPNTNFFDFQSQMQQDELAKATANLVDIRKKNDNYRNNRGQRNSMFSQDQQNMVQQYIKAQNRVQFMENGETSSRARTNHGSRFNTNSHQNQRHRRNTSQQDIQGGAHVQRMRSLKQFNDSFAQIHGSTNNVQPSENFESLIQQRGENVVETKTNNSRMIQSPSLINIGHNIMSDNHGFRREQQEDQFSDLNRNEQINSQTQFSSDIFNSHQQNRQPGQNNQNNSANNENMSKFIKDRVIMGTLRKSQAQPTQRQNASKDSYHRLGNQFIPPQTAPQTHGFTPRNIGRLLQQRATITRGSQSHSRSNDRQANPVVPSGSMRQQIVTSSGCLSNNQAQINHNSIRSFTSAARSPQRQAGMETASNLIDKASIDDQYSALQREYNDLFRQQQFNQNRTNQALISPVNVQSSDANSNQIDSYKRSDLGANCPSIRDMQVNVNRDLQNQPDSWRIFTEFGINQIHMGIELEQNVDNKGSIGLKYSLQQRKSSQDADQSNQWVPLDLNAQYNFERHKSNIHQQSDARRKLQSQQVSNCYNSSIGQSRRVQNRNMGSISQGKYQQDRSGKVAGSTTDEIENNIIHIQQTRRSGMAIQPQFETSRNMSRSFITTQPPGGRTNLNPTDTQPSNDPSRSIRHSSLANDQIFVPTSRMTNKMPETQPVRHYMQSQKSIVCENFDQINENTSKHTRDNKRLSDADYINIIRQPQNQRYVQHNSNDDKSEINEEMLKELEAKLAKDNQNVQGSVTSFAQYLKNKVIERESRFSGMSQDASNSSRSRHSNEPIDKNTSPAGDNNLLGFQDLHQGAYKKQISFSDQSAKQNLLKNNKLQKKNMQRDTQKLNSRTIRQQKINSSIELKKKSQIYKQGNYTQRTRNTQQIWSKAPKSNKHTKKLTNLESEQFQVHNVPTHNQQLAAIQSFVKNIDKSEQNWQNSISKRSQSQMTSRVTAKRHSYETEKVQQTSKSQSRHNDLDQTSREIQELLKQNQSFSQVNQTQIQQMLKLLQDDSKKQQPAIQTNQSKYSQKKEEESPEKNEDIVDLKISQTKFEKESLNQQIPVSTQPENTQKIKQKNNKVSQNKLSKTKSKVLTLNEKQSSIEQIKNQKQNLSSKNSGQKSQKNARSNQKVSGQSAGALSDTQTQNTAKFHTLKQTNFKNTNQLQSSPGTSGSKGDKKTDIQELSQKDEPDQLITIEKSQINSEKVAHAPDAHINMEAPQPQIQNSQGNQLQIIDQKSLDQQQVNNAVDEVQEIVDQKQTDISQVQNHQLDISTKPEVTSNQNNRSEIQSETRLSNIQEPQLQIDQSNITPKDKVSEMQIENNNTVFKETQEDQPTLPQESLGDGQEDENVEVLQPEQDSQRQQPITELDKEKEMHHENQSKLQIEQTQVGSRDLADQTLKYSEFELVLKETVDQFCDQGKQMLSQNIIDLTAISSETKVSDIESFKDRGNLNNNTFKHINFGRFQAQEMQSSWQRFDRDPNYYKVNDQEIDTECGPSIIKSPLEQLQLKTKQKVQSVEYTNSKTTSLDKMKTLNVSTKQLNLQKLKSLDDSHLRVYSVDQIMQIPFYSHKDQEHTQRFARLLKQEMQNKIKHDILIWNQIQKEQPPPPKKRKSQLQKIDLNQMQMIDDEFNRRSSILKQSLIIRRRSIILGKLVKSNSSEQNVLSPRILKNHTNHNNNNQLLKTEAKTADGDFLSKMQQLSLKQTQSVKQQSEESQRKKLNRRVIDSVKEVPDYEESRSDSSQMSSDDRSSKSQSSATFISELSLFFGQEESDDSSTSSQQARSANSTAGKPIKYKLLDQRKHSQFEKKALTNLKIKHQMKEKMLELFQKKFSLLTLKQQDNSPQVKGSLFQNKKKRKMGSHDKFNSIFNDKKYLEQILQENDEQLKSREILNLEDYKQKSIQLQKILSEEDQEDRSLIYSDISEFSEFEQIYMRDLDRDYHSISNYIIPSKLQFYQKDDFNIEQLSVKEINSSLQQRRSTSVDADETYQKQPQRLSRTSNPRDSSIHHQSQLAVNQNQQRVRKKSIYFSQFQNEIGTIKNMREKARMMQQKSLFKNMGATLSQIVGNVDNAPHRLLLADFFVTKQTRVEKLEKMEIKNLSNLLEWLELSCLDQIFKNYMKSLNIKNHPFGKKDKVIQEAYDQLHQLQKQQGYKIQVKKQKIKYLKIKMLLKRLEKLQDLVDPNENFQEQIKRDHKLKFQLIRQQLDNISQTVETQFWNQRESCLGQLNYFDFLEVKQDNIVEDDVSISDFSISDDCDGHSYNNQVSIQSIHYPAQFNQLLGTVLQAKNSHFEIFKILVQNKFDKIKNRVMKQSKNEWKPKLSSMGKCIRDQSPIIDRNEFIDKRLKQIKQIIIKNKNDREKFAKYLSDNSEVSSLFESDDSIEDTSKYIYVEDLEQQKLINKTEHAFKGRCNANSHKVPSRGIKNTKHQHFSKSSDIHDYTCSQNPDNAKNKRGYIRKMLSDGQPFNEGSADDIKNDGAIWMCGYRYGKKNPVQKLFLEDKKQDSLGLGRPAIKIIKLRNGLPLDISNKQNVDFSILSKDTNVHESLKQKAIRDLNQVQSYYNFIKAHMKRKPQSSSVFYLKYKRQNLLQEHQINEQHGSKACLLRFFINLQMLQMMKINNGQAIQMNMSGKQILTCVNPFLNTFGLDQNMEVLKQKKKEQSYLPQRKRFFLAMEDKKNQQMANQKEKEVMPDNFPQGKKSKNFKFVGKLQSLGLVSQWRKLQKEIQEERFVEISQYKSSIDETQKFPMYVLFEVLHVKRKTPYDHHIEQKMLTEQLKYYITQLRLKE